MYNLQLRMLWLGYLLWSPCAWYWKSFYNKESWMRFEELLIIISSFCRVCIPIWPMNPMHIVMCSFVLKVYSGGIGSYALLAMLMAHLQVGRPSCMNFIPSMLHYTRLTRNKLKPLCVLILNLLSLLYGADFAASHKYLIFELSHALLPIYYLLS